MNNALIFIYLLNNLCKTQRNFAPCYYSHGFLHLAWSIRQSHKNSNCRPHLTPSKCTVIYACIACYKQIALVRTYHINSFPPLCVNGLDSFTGYFVTTRGPYIFISRTFTREIHSLIQACCYNVLLVAEW